MLMNGLFIFAVYLKFIYPVLLIQICRHQPDDVFHKSRVLICTFRDPFLIRPFEYGIKTAASIGFGHIQQFFLPIAPAQVFNEGALILIQHQQPVFSQNGKQHTARGITRQTKDRKCRRQRASQGRKYPRLLQPPRSDPSCRRHYL